MPYSVNWYIPDEILYIHYWGVMTNEELRESLLKMHSLMESSPRNLVHAINDVGDITQSVALKDSMKIVREVREHPRVGWSISIREKSVLVKMGSALGSSLLKMRYRAFDTLDEALAHLELKDAELHWNKADPSVVEPTKV